METIGKIFDKQSKTTYKQINIDQQQQQILTTYGK